MVCVLVSSIYCYSRIKIVFNNQYIALNNITENISINISTNISEKFFYKFLFASQKHRFHSIRSGIFVISKVFALTFY